LLFIELPSPHLREREREFYIFRDAPSAVQSSLFFKGAREVINSFLAEDDAGGARKETKAEIVICILRAPYLP